MLSVAVSRAKLLNHSCFSLNLAIYGESHWNYVHSVLILLSVVDESRVLVAMDTNEKLHVIDVRSEEELEVQC